MTVEGLFAAFAWAGVVAYAAWRADLRVSQWIAAREKIEALRSVSTERVAELGADSAKAVAALQFPALSRRDPGTSDIELPDDIEAHILTWDDDWARDDERLNIRKKYLEFHTGNADETWQKVRRAVGIGEMP